MKEPYRLRFFVFVNGSWKSPDYEWQPTVGTWYHIVGVKSASHIRTYIDGDEVGIPQDHSGVVDKDPMNLRIGVGNYPGSFNGTIDEVRISDIARSAEWIKTSYPNQNNPDSFYSVGEEEERYSFSGTIASQVLDTGVVGARWDALCWDETLESGTDISFAVRASDTAFLKDAATPLGGLIKGDSPVTSGLPSGRYMQWRASLTTSDTSKTPTLHEVRVCYY